jgi:hypothetical protein
MKRKKKNTIRIIAAAAAARKIVSSVPSPCHRRKWSPYSFGFCLSSMHDPRNRFLETSYFRVFFVKNLGFCA